MLIFICIVIAAISGILTAILCHFKREFLSEISSIFAVMGLTGAALCFIAGFLALGLYKVETVKPQPSSVIHLAPFNASATENKVYYIMDTRNRTISYLDGNSNSLSINTISLDDTKIIKGTTDKPYIEKFDCKVTCGKEMLFQACVDKDVYHLIIPDTQ